MGLGPIETSWWMSEWEPDCNRKEAATRLQSWQRVLAFPYDPEHPP